MIFSCVLSRCLALGASLLALAALPSSAQAAPVPGDKVAVLPLVLEGKVPARPAALENAISKGLEVAVGAPRVMIGPPVAQKLNASAVRVACTDPRCWMAVGQALGARHLVTGLVQRKEAMFEVEFQLFDAADGHQVLTEHNKCEATDCSIAELCRLTVLDLARKGLGKATAAAASPPAPVQPTAAAPAAPSAASGGAPSSAAEPAASPSLPPSAPPVVASANELSSSATAAGPSWRSWYPAVSIGTGVAVGAVGAYFIYKDGKGNCPQKSCRKNYRSMPGGIAGVAGGAVLIASGVVVALLGEPPASAAHVPRLSVGLNSLWLSGRF
jgi:hypothetical protein